MFNDTLYFYLEFYFSFVLLDLGLLIFPFEGWSLGVFLETVFSWIFELPSVLTRCVLILPLSVSFLFLFCLSVGRVSLFLVNVDFTLLFGTLIEVFDKLLGFFRSGFDFYCWLLVGLTLFLSFFMFFIPPAEADLLKRVKGI